MRRPGAGGFAGGSGPAAGGTGGRMAPPGGGGVMPPPGGFGSPVLNSADDTDPNLVELAVYGIAALYERFPPKPPAEQAGAPGATPPAAQPAK
jgi:hypothetical protein